MGGLLNCFKFFLLSGNGDFNNIKENGIYTIKSLTNNNFANSPDGVNGFGILIVGSFDTNGKGVQILICGEGRFYSRTFWEGGFYDWGKA